MPEFQRVKSAPGRHSTHLVFGPDGEPALTVALAAVPAHSPHQAGDWVVYHGHVGDLAPSRYGWRGYVTGHMGSTLLRGVTDDGRQWFEHWGSLEPDGTHRCTTARCLCCPHPPRRPRQRYEQTSLELFAGAAA